MPGKSRKAKEKRHFRAVAVTEQPASVIPPAVDVNINESAAVPKTVPAARIAKPAPVSTYSYINRELLTITLLSAAMLTVVIVVSKVLS